jgi:uncharacterized protein YjbI with pentapeptide repeats
LKSYNLEIFSPTSEAKFLYTFSLLEKKNLEGANLQWKYEYLDKYFRDLDKKHYVIYYLPGKPEDDKNINWMTTFFATLKKVVWSNIDTFMKPIRLKGGSGGRKGAFLAGPIFMFANLKNIDLQAQKLDYYNFFAAQLNELRCVACSLKNADLRFTDLTTANFYSANLNGAKLNHANLTGIGLVNAQLNKADLSYSNLTDASFDYAVLNDANFKGAYIIKNKNNVPITLGYLKNQRARWNDENPPLVN